MGRSDLDEWLQVLGLHGAAVPEAKLLKRAYLNTIKQHPPDRDPEGFKRVREAFEKLEAHRAAPESSSDHAAKPDVARVSVPPLRQFHVTEPLREMRLLLHDFSGPTRRLLELLAVLDATELDGYDFERLMNWALLLLAEEETMRAGIALTEALDNLHGRVAESHRLVPGSLAPRWRLTRELADVAPKLDDSWRQALADYVAENEKQHRLHTIKALLRLDYQAVRLGRFSAVDRARDSAPGESCRALQLDAPRPAEHLDRSISG